MAKKFIVGITPQSGVVEFYEVEESDPDEIRELAERKDFTDEGEARAYEQRLNSERVELWEQYRAEHPGEVTTNDGTGPKVELGKRVGK